MERSRKMDERQSDGSVKAFFVRRDNRRAELRGLSGGLLASSLGLALPRVASAAQDATLPPGSGTFVGEVPTLDAYFALVVGAGATTEEPREVRAYVCDGVAISTWFKGQAARNVIELTSENGTWIAAVLTPEGAAGALALADGASASFMAPPATGVAGLYDVTLAPDGALSGTKVGSSGRLAARVVEDLDEEMRLVAGVLTPEAGPRVPFAAFATPDASGELQLIALPSGQAKGGGKKDGGHESIGAGNGGNGFIEQ
jgi:hypothetical protein